MKQLIIFSVLIISVQVLEGKSFDFGSWFGGSDKTSAESTVQEQSSPDTLSHSQQENASFSLEEELKQTVTESESLSNSTIQEQILERNDQDESLKVDNVIDKSLNNSYGETESSTVISKTDAFHSTLLNHTSSENGTEGGAPTTVVSSGFQNSSTTTDEIEDVVLEAQPSTFTVVTRTIYQKTIDWVGDTYTLSILIPIASGVLFALTIIIIIATCRCIRRKCRRRSFRKRVLPDSIKNLRPSDQARLLGDCCDSSDEF